MQFDISDIAFLAFVLMVAILLMNSGGGGGRRSRVPVQI
jgi:hypothetical protein